MGALIKVENLSKQYRLGDVGTGSLKDDFKRFRYKLMGKEDPFLQIGEVNDRTKKSDSDYVWALKDINFEIEQGDVVGIIGRNGAGKSTLLKILSRTTAPTTGSVKVKGRIASLLEVGTGFHGELSGRANIYLNGAIMGLRKWEIDKKMDEIIDFAGVEKYLDTPVKRYSSGMYVRLAFAVAAHLEPDILIVDEVLAVGDLEFQKKCLGKMKDVSDKQGRTILFVSHDLNAVKSFCKTSSLLHNGEIVTSGPTSFVIEKYLSDDKSHFYQSSKCKANELFVESVLVLDSSQESKYLFDISEEIYVSFKLKNVSHSSNANGKYDLFVTVSDAHRKKIFSAEIKITEDLYTLNINKNQLTKGVYYIEVMINIPKYGPTEHLRDVVKFQILDDSSWMFKHGDYDCGAVFGNYSWIIN